MKPFFSIVVPSCNVGKYIRECLESIQNQSFKDWECLCIIEDSTDDTEKIIREFADNDARFRVFTQPRSGSVSVPRNTGVEKSEGEYIIFCDGDDSIVDGSLEKIAAKISERPGADIYPCIINEYRDGGENLRNIDNFVMKHPAELSGHDAVLLLYNYWRKPSPMLQMNLWRRDYLNEHNLRCVPGLVHQDSEFSPRALYLAQRIVPLHEPLYRYRRNTSSVTMRPHEPGYENKLWAVILKSLFAFHAVESAKPGFDKRIAQCWAKAWTRLLLVNWFYPASIRDAPRDVRMATLKSLFADGFGDFLKIASAATRVRKIAAWLVYVYVKHPSTAWLVECFFKRLYFPLAEAKNKSQGTDLHDFLRKQEKQKDSN